MAGGKVSPQGECGCRHRTSMVNMAGVDRRIHHAHAHPTNPALDGVNAGFRPRGSQPSGRHRGFIANSKAKVLDRLCGDSCLWMGRNPLAQIHMHSAFKSNPRRRRLPNALQYGDRHRCIV